jgi:hypothetical protein
MADENPNPNPNPASGQNPPAAGAGAGAAAGSAGSGDPWFAKSDLGLSQDTRDYLATKNYAGLEDAFKAKRTFETLARDRNALTAPDPARLADWDGWSRLGWEADPAKYAGGVPVYEKFKGDADYEGFHGDIVKSAHELKIPLPLAKAMAEKIGAFMSARNQALDIADQQEKQREDAALRQAWGAQYDQNAALANRAMVAFGMDGDNGLEMKALMGAAKFVDHFYRIGKAMGEDRLVTTSEGGSGTSTPASARAERQRLKSDPDFLASLNDARHPNHRTNKEKWNRLIEQEAKG